MLLPQSIANSIQARRTLGIDCDSEGIVRRWPSFNGCYPPLGYLRWTVLEVGNGDTYGYYWPVGHEERVPLVCTTEHDVFRVVPIASDLAGCLRLLMETRPKIANEVKEVAQGCDVPLAIERPGAATTDRALSTLDPHSPELLLVQAREAMRTGDLTLCERSLLDALDVLPEYGLAIFVLSQLYRRQQRFADAAQALLDMICAPLCFGGGYDMRLKCLRTIQGMPDVLIRSDDVLWHQRSRLTFRIGVRENDDFLIYEEAIASCLATGAGVKAIWLRMLVGELLALETVSFQERYGWTHEKHRHDLARDLTAAGLSARLPALGVTDV
jgi:hypothetical protein